MALTVLYVPYSLDSGSSQAVPSSLGSEWAKGGSFEANPPFVEVRVIYYGMVVIYYGMVE